MERSCTHSSIKVDQQLSVLQKKRKTLQLQLSRTITSSGVLLWLCKPSYLSCWPLSGCWWPVLREGRPVLVLLPPVQPPSRTSSVLCCTPNRGVSSQYSRTAVRYASFILLRQYIDCVYTYYTKSFKNNTKSRFGTENFYIWISMADWSSSLVDHIYLVSN